MTRQQINALRKLHAAIEAYGAEIEKQVHELQDMQVAFMKAAQACQHRHPSGRTAIKEIECDTCDQPHRVCTICNMSLDGPKSGVMMIGGSGMPPPAVIKDIMKALPSVLQEIFSGGSPKSPPPMPEGGDPRHN